MYLESLTLFKLLINAVKCKKMMKNMQGMNLIAKHVLLMLFYIEKQWKSHTVDCKKHILCERTLGV